MIPRVSLYVRVGQNYYKPAIAAKKIKPKYAVIDGKPTHVPAGVYYVRYAVDGKRKWESAGEQLDAAEAYKGRLESELRGKVQVAIPAPALEKTGTPKTLAVAAANYLNSISRANKPRTHLVYKRSLLFFCAYCAGVELDRVNGTTSRERREREAERAKTILEACSSVLLESITTDLMLEYANYLRARKLVARSVSNIFENAMTFLKAVGVTLKIPKSRRPTAFVVEEEPEAYEQEELDRLFAVCTPEERLLFRFFLFTGFREQEVQHFVWRCIDTSASVVRVRSNEQYKWSPKAYKGRLVPCLPEFIAELLSGKPANAKPTDLVFPGAEGRPDGHMLRTLKVVAKKAGLDPENCWLHKFRATFATTAIDRGVSIRTVQEWLGHSDLQSTMRYLRPARGKQAQEMMRLVWGAA